MFSVLAEDNKHNLCVLSSNIQSIHSKFSELEAFVDELSTLNFNTFNIICLQESWLSETDDLSLIQLKGYDCIAHGKSCSNKGGLITYVDQHIKYEVLINLNIYGNWEGQLIQVNGGGLTPTFTIGNIYRPPRYLNENYNEFVNEFSMVVSSLKNNKKQNPILAGDYNINMLKINEHEHCSNFFDMLTSFSLFPPITFPTRFSDRKGTLIDTFFLYTD